MAEGTGRESRIYLLAAVTRDPAGLWPARAFGASRRRSRSAVRLLLVCATLMELRACLSLPPALDAPETAAACEAADAGGHVWLDPPPALPLPGCTLDLLVCGVGPVASSLALGRFLGRKLSRSEPLGGIFNLGLAGSYNIEAAPLGSLVLATEEVYPEYGVRPHPPHPEDGQETLPLPLGFPQAEIEGRKVFDRLPLAPESALGNMGLNWHSGWKQGASVTVAGVSGTPERARRLAALCGGITENMEGFSLALGAAMAGIPFIELRAVSNAAGLRPPKGWDMPAALAALGRGTRDLLAPFLPVDTPR